LEAFQGTNRLFDVNAAEIVGKDFASFLAEKGLFNSRESAVKAVEEGVVMVNRVKRKEANSVLTASDLQDSEQFCVIHAGKGNPYIFCCS
jgi:tyrosyl-tRNA synthetase